MLVNIPAPWEHLGYDSDGIYSWFMNIYDSSMVFGLPAFPKCMIYFMENPNLKWMIFLGYPLFRKPPYHDISILFCGLSYLTFTSEAAPEAGVDQSTRVERFGNHCLIPLLQGNNLMFFIFTYIYIYILHICVCTWHWKSESRIGSLMIGVLITAPNMSNPVADRASAESQTDSCNAGPRYIYLCWLVYLVFTHTYRYIYHKPSHTIKFVWSILQVPHWLQKLTVVLEASHF